MRPANVCAVVLASALLPACTGLQPLGCIHPPVTSSHGDYSASVDLAAKLEKLPAEGNVKVGFETSVKQDFDMLSDTNAALLLFLNAIDCYLQKGAVGQKAAEELVATVRAWWSAKNGLSGSGAGLSPVERSLIEKFPRKELIFARLREFGVQ